MYCVDYQMSYPLLVVPYAPQQYSKALESQSLSRAFSWGLNRETNPIIHRDAF